MATRRVPVFRITAGLLVFWQLCSYSARAQQCAAPASWFPSTQTPDTDDGIAPNNLCAFYQWSWQKFLWLTQEVGPNRELRFELLPTREDLFGNPTGPSTQTPPPFAKIVKSGPLDLTAYHKASGAESLSDVGQATFNGVLVHPDNAATGTPDRRAVYYSIYVNEIFYDFVANNKYYDPKTYLNAPATDDFPLVPDNQGRMHGAMELKASWRILEDNESADGYHVRHARINPLVTVPDNVTKMTKVVADKSRYLDVKVALVGLHVIGIVRDHPEFIWATFEHRKNAPDLPAGMNPIAAMPVSNSDWTFYRKDTPAFQCNQLKAPFELILDEKTQYVAPPTDVFRQFPFGSTNAGNAQTIQSINASVAQQLEPGSVWKNYELIGASWLQANVLLPGQNYAPNGANASLIQGSDRLSNATMETFTQAPIVYSNCFGCHDSQAQRPPAGSGATALPGKNLNLSHILFQNYFNRSEMAKREAASKAQKADAK